MALSEREQKLLEQMEQALYAEDPRFATRIRSHGDRGTKRRMLVGILAVLAGLGLVFCPHDCERCAAQAERGVPAGPVPPGLHDR